MRDFAFYRRITGQSRLQRIYNRAAAGWEAGIATLGYPEAYRQLCHAALASLPVTEPERVLDAGCGSGAMSAALLQDLPAPPELHLLDLSPQMLAEAAARLPLETIRHQGMLGGGPLPCPPFSRILCAHVIEHCPDPLPPLQWLHEHLAPCGQLILVVSKPHWCTALLRWRWGNAAYHPEQVLGLLQQSGFINVEIRPNRKGPPSRTSCGYLARRA
ncbi:class I SAM-dependent DNA methyltransferase [Leisingera sp. ANG-M1]|uniref:class I SAM-dependent DNA methyltransferase n=1 Tax=Leisingera sp. ANG-M1 TaxID=1577895 RepID=UPI000690B116|nr:class I SAM-dependent methyltransferase [Leisingera sp. ANG-M1]